MKESLRKTCLNLRKSMSKEIVILSSQIICEKILSLKEYKIAKKVGLYIPINGEVDLSQLWHNSKNNQKSYYFPKIANQRMFFLPATAESTFIKNSWGILEPDVTISKAIATCNLDIIILPLVAFDESGNRIGMGGGYYDRELTGNKSTLLIGAAYEMQKQKIIQSDFWDVKIDMIVTEKAIYKSIRI